MVEGKWGVWSVHQAAHSGNQIDLRANTAGFHLIPLLQLEKCIESQTGTDPCEQTPEIGIVASRPRGSTATPGLRVSLWQRDWAWKEEGSRNNYKSNWGVSTGARLKMKSRLKHDGTYQVKACVPYLLYPQNLCNYTAGCSRVQECSSIAPFKQFYRDYFDSSIVWLHRAKTVSEDEATMTTAPSGNVGGIHG